MIFTTSFFLAIEPEVFTQEQAALALLHQRCSAVQKGAQEIAQLQSTMTLPPSNEVASALQVLHGTVRQLIAQTALDAHTLSSATILSPATESDLAALVHELYIQAKQMDLYDAELRLACEGRRSLLAALVVAKQPFPQTVMKQRHVVDAVVVKLLQGTQVTVRPTSKVRAGLMMEEYGGWKKKNNFFSFFLFFFFSFFFFSFTTDQRKLQTSLQS